MFIMTTLYLKISGSDLIQQFRNQKRELSPAIHLNLAHSDGFQLIFHFCVVQIRLSLVCFGASQILQVDFIRFGW